MGERLSRKARRKRRTQGDLSSSSSESSSSSDSEMEEIEKQGTTIEPTADLTIEGLNIPKGEVKSQDQTLSVEDTRATKEKIQGLESGFQDIKRLELDVSSSNSQGKLRSISNQIDDAREKLLGAYLGKMVGNYGDDLDALRGKSDFRGEMSVKLLARLLKESGNVFDDETLSSIVKE
ncbi:DEKNAAC103655 [Brettanomyces naardenensis]|uniref:DEKNAAC103655 n=1 Tax=Brettanomyces naardenensis TaxID=13370 RepID=A0A448YND6_BRENA|nr:DEKNAAC103655 [Brettanomyces naardenensis]